MMRIGFNKGYEIFQDYLENSSYWASKGFDRELFDKVAALIPYQGKVNDPVLDRFRRMQNLYYDLYNNGLGNRASSVAGLTGFRSTDFKIQPCEYSTRLYMMFEIMMAASMLSAALEQKFINHDEFCKKRRELLTLIIQFGVDISSQSWGVNAKPNIWTRFVEDM